MCGWVLLIATVLGLLCMGGCLVACVDCVTWVV